MQYIKSLLLKDVKTDIRLMFAKLNAKWLCMCVCVCVCKSHEVQTVYIYCAERFYLYG